MTVGIILSGGRSTRLGPLATQINKSLVSVGQRPHLFHQLELLREAGCDRILIVIDPDTATQMNSAVRRSGVNRSGDVTVHILVEEWKPRGPVGGVLWALQSEHCVGDDDAFILMSDTFIDEPLRRGSDPWVGVAAAPSTRSFCYYDPDIAAGEYRDDVVAAGTEVTIGAYYYPLIDRAHRAAAAAMLDNPDHVEVGMAQMLNRVPAHTVSAFTTWLDIGDVAALARARRTRFITRASHELVLDDAGLITKRGDTEQFQRQLEWMANQTLRPPRQANLIPTVYRASGNTLTMEYIDLPTLAELWLYWPGRADTWRDIMASIVSRLYADLWETVEEDEPDVHSMEHQLFITKARTRLAEYDRAKYDEVGPLLAEAATLMTDRSLVRGHGDPNFNNILYSVNTGSFKLVDPRGDEAVPLSYELAKLRYSYHAGFSAITHGLASVDATGAARIWPSRGEEAAAMDEVIEQFMPLGKCAVGEACLLLAATPLHSKAEAEIMYARGRDMLRSYLT